MKQFKTKYRIGAIYKRAWGQRDPSVKPSSAIVRITDCVQCREDWAREIVHKNPDWKGSEALLVEYRCDVLASEHLLLPENGRSKAEPRRRLLYRDIDITEVNPIDLPLYISWHTTPEFNKLLKTLELKHD